MADFVAEAFSKIVDRHVQTPQDCCRHSNV
jgi:hypothetical protein